MLQSQSSNHYDLEERTLLFAQKIRQFTKKLPRSLINLQDIPQLIRSSGSVGANYIEANEAVSKKDFVHRIKISRKEAKESKYWLMLIEVNSNDEEERGSLLQEATELMMILSAIMRKSQ
jgi:four helix bundle protein